VWSKGESHKINRKRFIIKFSKLQATGNDFVLIDNRLPCSRKDSSESLYFDISQFKENEWMEFVNTICDRHFGIGADGVIVVQNSATANLKMRIFNSDGSEAEACGNGLRCFTKYAMERNMATIKSLQGEDSYLSIETLAGIRKAKAYTIGQKVNRVKVSMGTPEFRAEKIPTTISQSTLTNDCQQQTMEMKQSSLLGCFLSVGDNKLQLWLLSMGNPHAVNFISQTIVNFPLSEVGPMIEKDPLFPKRTNFEIARVLDKGKIEARVWERGVGETLSCGSGACAIAIASKLLGYTEDDVDIILKGGILSISWDGIGEVKLTGPVDEVFTGNYLI